MLIVKNTEIVEIKNVLRSFIYRLLIFDHLLINAKTKC